jgi:hypothetical protein
MNFRADQSAVPPVVPEPEDDEYPTRTGGQDTDYPARPTAADMSPVPPARPAQQDTGAPGAASSAAAEVDGPLLGDAAGLHARWQQAQAEFVENPREALVDADDLVEQTAQALVGTFRQRQQELRLMWGHRSADELAVRGDAHGTATNGTSADGTTDTEQLRLVMRRYRALFSELCRP